MAVDNPSNLMPDQEILIEGDAGFVPKASPSDAGKVLGVLNSSGDVGWVVDQSGTFIQVQADWAETDSSQPSYIDHKPDLSVYATASSVETALAGKQDTISDLSEIRSGASAGATAVQPATLESYATTSAVNTALAGKQDTISDLSDIRSGAALGATAVQPSDLPSSDELLPSASTGDAGKVLTVDSQGEPQWVTPSGGTTYSAGDGIAIDGNNVISADVDGTTIGIDASTKKIKSLQVIPTKTSDLQNDSNFVTASSLATVATSGNYSDLSGKPTIPSVDQTYNASSTNAQSGTAVAGAIAGVKQVPASTSSDSNKVLTVDSNGAAGWQTPPVDKVPDVTSSDIGKVLKANYSGGQGSCVWATDSDTTYTAGNMIAINANNSNAIGVSTTAGITDIQQVAALPANPVATVLYLIPST